MTIKELYDTILVRTHPWSLRLRKQEGNILKTIDYYVYFATIEPYFDAEIDDFKVYCDTEDEICFDIILK